jgi:NTP pyrophosphatase (non-canonical NTP hydrolase)
MEFNEYQKLATHTGTFSGLQAEYALMYVCLGLAGESGELIEKIKKGIRNHEGVFDDEARRLIKLEIGDVLWYLSQIARMLDIPFDDAASANIKKLEDRAARGVLKSEGDTR